MHATNVFSPPYNLNPGVRTQAPGVSQLQPQPAQHAGQPGHAAQHAEISDILLRQSDSHE